MTSKCVLIVLAVVLLCQSCSGALLRDFSFGGHWYELHDSATNSLAACNTYGLSRSSPGTSETGHSACPTTQDEYDAVYAECDAELNFNWWYDCVRVWATDSAVEGEWVWGCPSPEDGLFSIGSTVQSGWYADWEGGQPNNYGSGGQGYGFICEDGLNDFDDGGYATIYCLLEFDDYDECLVDTPCGSGEVCANTYGSYTCTPTSTTLSPPTTTWTWSWSYSWTSSWGDTTAAPTTTPTTTPTTPTTATTTTTTTSATATTTTTSADSTTSSSAGDTEEDGAEGLSTGNSGDSGSGVGGFGSGLYMGVAAVGGLLFLCCVAGGAAYVIRARGSSSAARGRKTSVASKLSEGLSAPIPTAGSRAGSQSALIPAATQRAPPDLPDAEAGEADVQVSTGAALPTMRMSNGGASAVYGKPNKTPAAAQPSMGQLATVKGAVHLGVPTADAGRVSQLETVRVGPGVGLDGVVARARGSGKDDFDDALSDLLCDSTLVPLTELATAKTTASLPTGKQLDDHDDRIAFVEEPYAGDEDAASLAGVVFEDEPFNE